MSKIGNSILGVCPYCDAEGTLTVEPFMGPESLNIRQVICQQPNCDKNVPTLIADWEEVGGLYIYKGKPVEK